jgi:3-oxoacyl-[acyl-carrier protein] reductase
MGDQHGLEEALGFAQRQVRRLIEAHPGAYPIYTTAGHMGRHGIPVYEIRPGIVLTGMTTGVKAMYDRLLLEQGLALTRRWGLPEDVGRAVLALAEGLFPYSTGQVIYVDGGMHVPRF